MPNHSDYPLFPMLWYFCDFISAVLLLSNVAALFHYSHTLYLFRQTSLRSNHAENL